MNKKRFITLLSLFAVAMMVVAQGGDKLVSKQILKQKIVDEGGSGMFKAVAVKEKGLPDFVIYRPKDFLHTHARQGALPILMFGNGGCSDTSIGYERMLTEIASHGYVVVAIGEMQDKRLDRPEGHTPSSELKRGLDWIVEQSKTKGSDYYQNIDPDRVAAAGHSCGGAQVLANAADARLKTYLILNAGMGDMEMADASKESLPNVHAPILYVVGGPDDVAYQNAQLDYDRIHHVPVALANHPASGHGGTYHEQYGGDYGRMVIDWLDWQLKGKKENADIFLKGDLKNYKGWDVKAKNFKQRPGKLMSLKMPCQLLKGIKERDYSIYLPGSYATDTLRSYPVLYLMHGSGGDESAWLDLGFVNRIMDNLIAEGKVEPMIVVMPNINPSVEAEAGETSNNLNYKPVMTKFLPKYKEGLVEQNFPEIVNFIDAHYSTLANKAHRAIAGLSMGGMTSMFVSANYPDLFDYVGLFSAGLDWTGFNWDFPAYKNLDQKLENQKKAGYKLYWIGIGNADFLYKDNQAFMKKLDGMGFKYTYHESTRGHLWSNWRQYLLIFAQKLFK